MNIKTNVKAGGINGSNHNEKLSTEKSKSISIKTGLKAGSDPGGSKNHNEKLNSDNNSSIEEKKTLTKKLRLKKETIRELNDKDLKAVAGGAADPTHIVTHCDCSFGGNHNEKLSSDDNNDSIEQKKTIGKKLRLSKETIRELKDSDLKAVAGGAEPTTGGTP